VHVLLVRDVLVVHQLGGDAGVAVAGKARERREDGRARGLLSPHGDELQKAALELTGVVADDEHSHLERR
jgi:hypothetical protein